MPKNKKGKAQGYSDKVVTTPFGELYGRELKDAQSLYLYFYDMVNDGASNDYQNSRNLYADPMKYLTRMKGNERAPQKYDPLLEEEIEN